MGPREFLREAALTFVDALIDVIRHEIADAEHRAADAAAKPAPRADLGGPAAETARRRVAKFDGDAEATIGKRRLQRPPPPVVIRRRPPNGSNGGNGIDKIAVPALVALARQKPIALVGGIKKNELLEHVREKYDLALESVAMQGTNACAADQIFDRIRYGNLGGVVLLEGLTETTQIKMVVEACKEAEVQYAYGDRAGTDSVRQALGQLDAKCAVAALPGASRRYTVPIRRGAA